MSFARCTRIVVFAVTWLCLCGAPAFAQTPPEVNGKIQIGYIPPKSLKFVATLDRLKQFQFLEQ